MANYIVTDTELTGIADAIRAKTGESEGLSFPSGFSSAIGGISNGDTWDGIGANPEFVQTLYTENLKLTDTDWDNVTISNTAQTIRDTSQIINNDNKITLNWNYDYAIIGQGKILPAYNNDIVPKLIAAYNMAIYGYTTGPSNLTEFMNNSFTSITSSQISNSICILYESTNYSFILNTGGVSGLTYTIAGAPTLNTSGIVNLKVPTIKASTVGGVFTQETIAALDKNNTILSFTWKLYRYKQHSILKSAYLNSVLNALITDYPQYTPQQS